jgi:D-alanyl-D-alanine carboxypeptidase (penicillin-binding protein 5/6)
MMRATLALAAVFGVLAVSVAGAQTAPPPEPRASAYLLINPETDEVLAAKAPDRAIPMASLTKMMTAIVARDRTTLNERVTVPESAAIGGSTADLVPGETISVRNLMTGLLVASGNDAAIALAEHSAGTENRFVTLMNRRARALDLSKTQFTNPHGLDEPGHVSSPRDLIVLAEAALEDPLIKQAVAERRASIPGPDGVGTRSFESKNLLLDIDEEADGVKTGMTDEAGFAIVAHATRPRIETELYLAMIGSPGEQERAADASALLDWGFAQYSRPMLVGPGDVLGEAEVLERPGADVGYAPASPLPATIRVGEPFTQTLVVPTEVAAPLAEGEEIGEVVYEQEGREIGRVPLVTTEAVEEPSIWDRVRGAWERVIP